MVKWIGNKNAQCTRCMEINLKWKVHEQKYKGQTKEGSMKKKNDSQM